MIRDARRWTQRGIFWNTRRDLHRRGRLYSLSCLVDPQSTERCEITEEKRMSEIPEAAQETYLSGLTDAEKLSALQTYLAVLKPMEAALRARVTEDMGARHVERVGAYLPDGTKLASVGYTPGRTTAKVTDPEAALKWCLDRYPDEIVKAINPAFLKALTDYAKKVGKLGDEGVDPRSGEVLPFIQVVQGSPYITVTTTDEGVDRMAGLAGGFVAMLEGSN